MQGEGERLEFKRSFQNDAVETVVAFANSHGGSLVVGVDNDGNPVGTTFGRETTATILNRISSATEPTVIPEVQIIERYGSGIGRIDDACKEAGLPTPKIENQAGGFTVIFSKAPAGEGTPPVTGEVTGEVAGEVTSEVLQFLRVLAHGPLTRSDAQEELGLKGQANFRDRYLGPASDAGLIEMTIPDKPRSSRQKYRLTGKGRSIAEAQ